VADFFTRNVGFHPPPPKYIEASPHFVWKPNDLEMEEETLV
jgi:hypothetical protein